MGVGKCSASVFCCLLGYVPETSTSTESSYNDTDQIEMDNAEQFEGENTHRSHDKAGEGGWSKEEQSSGHNRGSKMTADDYKVNLDFLKK